MRSLVELLPDFGRMDWRNTLSFSVTAGGRSIALIAPCDRGEDGCVLSNLASSIVVINSAVCAFCAALNPNILMEIPYG